MRCSYNEYANVRHSIIKHNSHKISLIVDVEIFTDCYYIAYKHIQSARKAKLIYDRKTFYGGK